MLYSEIEKVYTITDIPKEFKKYTITSERAEKSTDAKKTSTNQKDLLFVMLVVFIFYY